MKIDFKLDFGAKTGMQPALRLVYSFGDRGLQNRCFSRGGRQGGGFHLQAPAWGYQPTMAERSGRLAMGMCRTVMRVCLDGVLVLELIRLCQGFMCKGMCACALYITKA